MCQKSHVQVSKTAAFYDASGNEIDYFLTSAYEGSIYDASASAYLLNDEQVMNTGEDKFSSIAGANLCIRFFTEPYKTEY